MLDFYAVYDAIQYEALVAPKDAIVPLPDSRIISRPGWWQIITPSLKRGGLNHVYCDMLQPGEANSVIERTIAEYRNDEIRFRWVVPPWSTPNDMAARLEANGLVTNISEVMYKELDACDEGGANVELVDDLNVRDFTAVMARGWEADPEPLHRLNRALLDHPERRHRMFLSRDGGVAAGAATYVRLSSSAYLIGGVVLPEFRKRGHYRALVNARLRDAKAHGLQLATSVAREDTSAPALLRFGFLSHCTLPVFWSPW